MQSYSLHLREKILRLSTDSTLARRAGQPLTAPQSRRIRKEDGWITLQLSS